MISGWYYLEGQETKGPFSLDDFKSLFGTGAILPATSVWREGMADWAHLENCPDLAFLVAIKKTGLLERRPAHNPFESASHAARQVAATGVAKESAPLSDTVHDVVHGRAADKEAEVLKAKLEETTRQLMQVLESGNDLSKTNRQFQKDCELLRSKWESAIKEKRELQAQLDACEKELSLLKKKSNPDKKVLEDALQKESIALKKIAAHEDEIIGLKAKIKTLEDEKNAAATRLAESNELAKKNAEENRRLKDDIERLKEFASQKAALDELIRKLQEKDAEAAKLGLMLKESQDMLASKDREYQAVIKRAAELLKEQDWLHELPKQQEPLPDAAHEEPTTEHAPTQDAVTPIKENEIALGTPQTPFVPSKKKQKSGWGIWVAAVLVLGSIGGTVWVIKKPSFSYPKTSISASLKQADADTAPMPNSQTVPTTLENAPVLKNETWIIGPQFDGVLPFRENLAAVKKGKLWGYVNIKSEWVIPPSYEDARSFSEGFACVKKDGLWGFINQHGNWIIDPKYSEVMEFKEGLAPVRLNGSWGYLDVAGTLVIEMKVERASPFSKEGARVLVAGEWHLIDRSGNVISERGFEKMEPFSDGLAAVRDNGLWGFINGRGECVVEPKYEGAGSFSSDLAAVKSNGVWGYIDRRGMFAVAPQFLEAFPFSDATAVVRESGGGLCGAINRAGSWVVKPKCESMLPFVGGMAPVRMEKNGLWGFVDTEGRWLMCPAYDAIGEMADRAPIPVKSKGKWGCLEP